jgi:quinol-cytochrome oxidoreductase complex cytochrome b subunit
MGQLQNSFSDGKILEPSMVIAVLVGMPKILFASDWFDREETRHLPNPRTWKRKMWLTAKRVIILEMILDSDFH